ncbi:MAG: DMT family transporter [Planctomycetes bacterium]|nr:DMT family transporter [Planctomycetota bacterium]
MRSLTLFLGVLAVSTAPPLILMAGVPPFALAAWRLCVVALLFLPFTGRDMVRDLRKLDARNRLWIVLAGVLYGAHFSLFNLAFSYTSKESVVILLGAQPLMAAAAGAIWLNEKITRTMLGASMLACAGLALFVWHDYSFDAGHLYGDSLVLLCGVAIVGSYSFGRRLRAKMSLRGYLGSLYVFGGITCLTSALIAQDPLWGYEAHQWGWLATAVLVPTLVGHTLFHYVVKYVQVFYINLTILGEPIIALTLMYLLRNDFEVFAQTSLTQFQFLGGGLLLVGVAVGLITNRQKTESSA